MADFIIEILKYLGIIMAAWVLFSYTFNPRRTFDNITSTWHRSFANQHYSAQEFYRLVDAAIREKKITHLSIERVIYSDTFLGSREYLQIRRSDQMILICAAPFGTDYFISWRQGQPVHFLQDMCMRIPKIGESLTAVLFRKTFFQQDTDAMFREAVHQCVLAAINHITSTQAERVPIAPIRNDGGQQNIEFA